MNDYKKEIESLLMFHEYSDSLCREVYKSFYRNLHSGEYENVRLELRDIELLKAIHAMILVHKKLDYRDTDIFDYLSELAVIVKSIRDEK